jgi:MFS transporter, PAT family, beta-lactamase induction signal transducer AmpG
LQAAAPNPKPSLSWRDLADKRVALMLALGYSAGLPFLLVFGTLSVWMRESGVALTTIGLFSWLALAYSFKFLWSPVIDGVDVPVLTRLLGRRRAWMVVCQAIVVAGLVGMGLSSPKSSLAVLAAFTFLVAFGSATQDVVIDGWRIDAAPVEKQGVMAAAYQLGYRLALLCAGAGALYIAEFMSWSAAYFSMAALMGVGFLAALASPVVDREPEGGKPLRFDFARGVKEPVLDLYRRLGSMLVPILVMVALYRLPDFVAGVMANPLYIDLGFAKTDIANVSKIYGVWIGILGAFVGGYLVTRLGLRATLLIGAIIGAASNLMYVWLFHEGARIEMLVLAISIDNFSAGFAGTALIAYMSGLTGAGFAATQYALLSSLYALPGKFVGGVSGFMVTAYGYPTFFMLTAAVGIPVVALCVWVTRASEGASASVR